MDKEVKKILYDDKRALESLDDVEAINKFSDADANEIKNVVNNNAEILDELKNQEGIDINGKLDVNVFEQYKNENDLKVNQNVLDITNLKSNVEVNKNNIESNSNLIVKNTQDIVELNNKVDNKLDTNTFEANKNDFNTKIESNTNNIDDLTLKVKANTDYLDNTIKTTYSSNKWNNAYTQSQTNLTTINEHTKTINDLMSLKVNESQYVKDKQVLEQNIENNKQLANNNKLAIESNLNSINQLSQNVTKIIDGFVIEDSKTYSKNSMGYKLIDGTEHWYISIINQAQGNKTNDTSVWKVIESPTNIPSMDNYYNKQELNILLLPLEQRLQNSENNITNNQTKITQNEDDITTLNNEILTIKNDVIDLHDNKADKVDFESLKNNVDTNFYNKQEIDQQQKQQDNLILANSENIVKLNSNITEVKSNYAKLNDPQQNINALNLFGLVSIYFNPYLEGEKALYIRNWENNQLIIDNDEGDYYPNNKMSIVNKKYVDDKISSTIRFYKGEIKMFDTEDDFDNFNQQFNLILGQDYDVIEAGRYLLTGSFGTVGGSNYITENNLPYKEWGMDLSDHYGRYSSYTYFLQPGELKNINMTNFTQSAAGDISYSGGTSIERRRFSWSYGSQTKQEFTPAYKTVCAIKFLRNI